MPAPPPKENVIARREYNNEMYRKAYDLAKLDGIPSLTPYTNERGTTFKIDKSGHVIAKLETSAEKIIVWI